MDPCSVRSKIWFIDTQFGDESVKGGGVCIDPTGLILTVARVVAKDNLNSSISATGYANPDLYPRTLELLHCLPQFDLALLRVTSHANEHFDFLDLGEAVILDVGEDLFSFVLQSNLLYSAIFGYTSFPLPQNVHLPLISSDTTVISAGILDLDHNMMSNQRYRTLGSVTSREDVSFHHLHPDLPLIQVAGLGSVSATAGCPLFKLENGDFVGLISLQKYGFRLVIPLNFLKIFVDHVRSLYRL